MEERESSQTEEVAVQAAERDAVLSEAVRDAMLLRDVRFRNAAKKRVDIAFRAYTRGSAAKFAGYSRTSTEYENQEADQFFFAGYDGETWRDAVTRIIV